MAKPTGGTVGRAGLPAQSSVVSEAVLNPARPPGIGGTAPTGGITYRVIRTNEVDPTDAPMTHAEVPPIGAPTVLPGDDFQGKDRKAAKLTIASAATESIGDLADLLTALPSRTAMQNHVPKILTAPSSGRVAEENRNVRIRAFLYAASQEADRDWHLIIGRDPNSTPHVYMTAEVSGLPPQGSASFAQLQATRATYKQFFANNLPGPSYDFYDPPIPLEIEGSLFFDMTHASGQGPGPASLHKDIPTIWEIHPVSRILFEPK